MSRSQAFITKKGTRYFKEKVVSEETKNSLRNAKTAAAKLDAIIEIFVDLGFIEEFDKPT